VIGYRAAVCAAWAVVVAGLVLIVVGAGIPGGVITLAGAVLLWRAEL
jgi:hypothetical protein